MSANEKMTHDSKANAADTDTLYVVFHGEIVFLDSCNDDENIQAYAPEMDIHVYSAGAWLGENRIPSGLTLGLCGVEHGTACFVDDKELTLIFPDAQTTSRPRHMQIDLPRPEEIISGVRMDITPDTITVNGTGAPLVPKDGRLALAIIFQYRLSTPKAPLLYVKDGDVMPGFFPDWSAHNHGDGTPYVLHVYAEADCHPGAMHVEKASKDSAALIGIDVDITVDPDERMFLPVAAPPGLSGDEINMTLARRSPATADLGAQIQACPTGSLGWHPDGQEVGVLFGGPAACGHIVGVPKGAL